MPPQLPFLPYATQSIDDEDVEAVTAALKSAWLTTGPLVSKFEAALASTTGAKDAVVVSNGTAALHTAMHAVGIGPGDEVIVPAMTFVATANAVLYCGGRPVFADVEPDTLLISPESVASLIGPKTRAIATVDYAGQPCDYEALYDIVAGRNIPIVADACHALGGHYRSRPVGSVADITAFSFHPVKQITTGEGGAVVSNVEEYSARARVFRNHGITTDHRQREQAGSWLYEMVELGFNYRITDFQCALGISQLAKLERWVERRREIANIYSELLGDLAEVRPLAVRAGLGHAFHLYVIRVLAEPGGAGRARLFHYLRGKGIGVNVHYLPVHLHPFYQRTLGTRPGLCPVAERAYEEILSLPMFPAMKNSDVHRVVETLSEGLADS